MSAADQAKGPSAQRFHVASWNLVPDADGAYVDWEAAQPLAAALRELLEAAEGEFASPDVAKALKAIKRMASANVQARDALRGWETS